MSKEGIATLQHASMGLLCDPRKQEEILNDLWVEWVKLALELELENIVRRRFPGHSEGAYGRLERWIDELGFIGSDAQRLLSLIVSWFAAGAFTNWWKLPRKSRQRVNRKPAALLASIQATYIISAYTSAAFLVPKYPVGKSTC
jgi:hypothetical protein